MLAVSTACGTPPAPGLVPAAAGPPAWVGQRLTATGQSANQGSRLKTARAAEDQALLGLRAQVEALPLSGQTLGEAAKEPRTAQAIARGLESARTESIEYHPDGGAIAHISLELRELWLELADR